MAESEQVAPAALSVLERTVEFKWFEEACIELARGIMEKALQELDDALLAHKPKGYKVAGFRTKVLGSRVGDVRIRRRLYVKATKPKGKREKGRFVLDECLNLHPRRRMTEGLARLAISLALRLPFREVEAVLCEAGMSSLSHATIHQEVRRYGEELAKLQERIALGQACEGEVKRRKVPVIFLEVDGVMVRRQRSKKRRLEIKVGVGYEGWEEIGPDGKIRRLVRPWVFAGVYESVEAFWEALTGELERRYEIDDETIIVVNGDGAEWIQKTAREYLPNAIVQLDRFHLRRMVRQAFGGKVEKGLWELLQKGDDEAFLDTLESLVSKAASEQNRQDRRKVVAFIRLYREHLLDYRFRLQDGERRYTSEFEGIRLHGLGVVETVLDKKIANRMKKRGMAWSDDGAGAMVAFLVSRGNNKLQEALSGLLGPDVLNPVSVKDTVCPRIKKAGKEDPADWLKGRVTALASPVEGLWMRVLHDLVSPQWSAV